VILTWPWTEPAPAGQAVTIHETPAQHHDQVELLGIELGFGTVAAGTVWTPIVTCALGGRWQLLVPGLAEDRIYRKLPLL
jgi:hypothetical protein